MKPIAVIGDLNVDVVLSKMERRPRPGEELFLDRSILKAGGSAANTALTLAHAGCPVRLFSRIGTDEGAAFLVQALRSCGIDTSTIKMDPGASTGITVSLPFPGTAERAYLTFPGTLAETGMKDLMGGYLGPWETGIPACHLHCASFFIQNGLQSDTGPLLRDAKGAGLTTSLDPGRDPAVRRPAGGRPAGRARPWDMSALTPFFRFLDWFMPNSEELKGITGIRDTGRALEVFAAEVKGVVVKMGGAGVMTRHEGKIVRHPPRAASPLDSTCAGDCFDAGFLYGLSRGFPLGESVALGNRFGALAVSCLGLPARETIQSLLKEMDDG